MNLPIGIKKNLKNFHLIETIKGRLNDNILKFVNKNSKIVYLKIGEGVSAISIKQEMTALSFLKNKHVIVPSVLDFMEEKGRSFLLITGVIGIPAQRVKHLNKKEVLRVAAEALMSFHKIKVKKPSMLNTLEKDLKKIRSYIELQVINTDSFRQSNAGKTPEEIYKYLLKTKKRYFNDAFTHGDYCLPNLLINKNDYGFIDLGDCGIGDRYKDFSSLEVSIKKNYGLEWVETFYKFYHPLVTVDAEKIKYYQLIDQFGYNLNIEKYNKLYAQNGVNHRQYKY